MKKGLKGIIILTALVLMMESLVMGAEVTNSGAKLMFSGFIIHGNEYLVLAQGRTKVSPYNVITVTVDAMYHTDGSKSDFKSSRWSVINQRTGQIVIDTEEVKKEEPKSFTIGAVPDPSIGYAINVKGNNEKKNAKISGNVDNFNKY